MVRCVKREEALGMSSGGKNRTRICKANNLIMRCMTYQKSFLHSLQLAQEILPRQVIEELLCDDEGAPRQRDFRGSHLNDIRQIGRKILGNVRSGGWCADRRHGSCVGHVWRSCEHRRSAQAVAD